MLSRVKKIVESKGFDFLSMDDGSMFIAKNNKILKDLDSGFLVLCAELDDYHLLERTVRFELIKLRRIDRKRVEKAKKRYNTDHKALFKAWRDKFHG